MIMDFHFLRPWWLLLCFPLAGLAVILWHQRPKLHAWADVCDPQLLDYLIDHSGQAKRINSILLILFSALFMIISLAGPTWHKLPIPTYKPIMPRVLVLDMSEHMLDTDLSPDRLSRAKFKLRDLFSHKDVGQFGLVVYTGEPFVVSPLTDDGQTISSLLSTLTPDIMPVTGQNLDTALNEAAQLIKQAGFSQGDILVLTADTPSSEAVSKARKLAKQGIRSSILPVRANKDLNPLYQRFATEGGGELIPYSPDTDDLEHWMAASSKEERLALSDADDVPLWRDEGRWFLIPSLLLLIPVFRRGWIQRVAL
jgi:Ca-activated chloride channel homolog